MTGPLFWVAAFGFLATVAESWYWRSPNRGFENFITIANRAAGTISFVNPRSLRSELNYKLANGGEPLYFVCLFRPLRRQGLELWVGDRKNSRLEILNIRNRRVRTTGFLPTPNGTFHSMLTQRFDARRPLSFTTCDIDNVTIVHDVRSRRQLCLMKRPAQVAAVGAKPHDVSSDEKYAYVTYVGAFDGRGYIASYVARTCKLVAVTNTLKDPHVAVRFGSPKLFVAAQGGEFLTLSVPGLRLQTRTLMSSPHGIVLSFNSRFVYVTNIADGGVNAVVVFRVQDGGMVNCPEIRTTHATPHNPDPSFDSSRLYITHTIAGETFNSEWKIDTRTGCLDPKSERVFNSGDTPFGIALVSSRRIFRFLISQ